MNIVAGLGNPGVRYARTRHNLGFRVVEVLATEAGLSFGGSPFEARIARGRFEGGDAILTKPQTFMNLAGTAVGPLARWYKVPPGDVMVVHDDLDLPPGRIRIRRGGGDGGHRGLASVIEALGTDRIPRLRIGIGRSESAPEVWVLEPMEDEERNAFQAPVALAADAVRTWIREGIESCMNRFNAAGA